MNQRDRDILIERVKAMGYDRCEIIKPLACLYKDVLSIFREEAIEGRLLLVFSYRMTERCKGRGVCIRFGDGKRAIGISREVIEKGTECATKTLIHEISHLKYGDHTPRFYRYMDSLLYRYNRAKMKDAIQLGGSSYL